MDSIRQYVISVVAAALICGILSSLFEDGTEKMLIRMISGVFLTITAIAPIVKIDVNSFSCLQLQLTEKTTWAAHAGEKMARDETAKIIKAQLEAYILDKAADLNADVTVNVSLEEDGTPAQAEIKGSISPYLKLRLENILATELGITKEKLIWTG